MKHRQAALHVMKYMTDVDKLCGSLMVDLTKCMDDGHLCEAELRHINNTLFSVLTTLHSEMFEKVIEEHPDLAPRCNECCGGGSCNAESPEAEN